jgi:F-type H+-transporting ATPase subunit b
MPQFDFANPIVWAQLAWLGLAFLILYFGIVRMTLPKLAKTLDARESQVTNDIATAERAKGEADQMAAAYADGIEDAHKAARAAIAEAKAKAAASVEKAVAAGNAVIAEKATAADASLSKARSKALGEIEAVASDAASDIVERLTGKRPEPKLVAAAAKTALVA